jgi:hypothetical protein
MDNCYAVLMMLLAVLGVADAVGAAGAGAAAALARKIREAWDQLSRSLLPLLLTIVSFLVADCFIS